MGTSIVDAESVLALELGSITTRAILFDVVDGQYRYIASGTAPTTATAPYYDVGESVNEAVAHLEETTGRVLMDNNGQLLIPTSADCKGVDRLAITHSIGSELRFVVCGLLNDVSLESARNLAATQYGQVMESFSLNDRRKLEAQLDAMLRAAPDVVILAGGTENGAGRSVLKQVDLISLMCRILPKEKRPLVLYAGNQALGQKVMETLSQHTYVKMAPNLRPSIDVEDLTPGLDALEEMVAAIRTHKATGLEALTQVASAPLVSTPYAIGRMARFLSKIYDSSNGVLAVDLDARATTLAVATKGKLSLLVLPIGLANGISTLTDATALEELIKWLPMTVSPDEVRDYLNQKAIYPASIPMDAQSLAIEQAAARQVLRMAARQMQSRLGEMLSGFEPILAGGSILSRAPSPAQALLILLDGLQPTGIATVVLDVNGLMPALGAAAKFNSILPVQVLESGGFINLATVISPICDARYGTKILRVRMEYEDGRETRFEIRQGSITTISLQTGQTARIHLQTLQDVQIDPRSNRTVSSFKIAGGICGAVIDARGRPLKLPTDASRRRDILKKWLSALGG